MIRQESIFTCDSCGINAVATNLNGTPTIKEWRGVWVWEGPSPYENAHRFHLCPNCFRLLGDLIPALKK